MTPENGVPHLGKARCGKVRQVRQISCPHPAAPPPLIGVGRVGAADLGGFSKVRQNAGARHAQQH